ncbi:hypothetical protein RB597_000525 [Gaeumannomyces tritici]
MFWRFGSYASASAIDTILDKPEFAVEELLDESDLIQELKQHNVKLLEHLRRREVLEKLLDYAVAPKLEPVAVPDKDQGEDGDKGKALTFSFSRPRASSRATEGGSEADEAEKRRNKYAFVASEILSCENWSICEAIMDVQNRDLLRSFWNFLQRPSPLDPLQASYFTKVNESLFDKKTQEMIEFLKSVDGAVPNMLRHVDSPMVMDLLLKIISLERTANGQGIVEWLFTKNVMPSLLSFLGPEHSWATQTSAGDFIKAIITVSANASQNEQTCIGPNELTRQLVSRPCIEQLIGYMLGGGNALTVGVGIVIEVIRKNNSDYDPDVGVEANSVPSSRDPIYLGTLLRLFAENVPRFMDLIMIGQAQKPHLESTFGGKIQPLGFDRFKTCELMAELLHCSNMGLLNEVGSEDLIAARDAERQRLRAQGSLTAVRGEEAPSSAEDLTMRIPGASPADEVRRLEVTNISDDDGFEEVIGAAEMAEDTSHEFIKAEEEIQQSLPTSSFLDKDEDDFVDEPLSSPRLNVSDIKMEDHQFEDPEMVVEPLSPKKLAMPDVASPEATSAADPMGVTTAIKEIEELGLSDDHLGEDLDVASGSHVEVRPASPEAGSSPPSFEAHMLSVSDAQPAATPETKSSSQADMTATAVATALEPHPEDTPAPLFSTPSKQPADAEAKVVPTATTPAADPDTTMEDPKGDAPNEPATAGAVEAQEKEGGEASDAVPAPKTETQAASEDNKVTPVVGDFLKMQFVEHRVVPTILSFFFTYPWNNFLHNVVYDVVQQVFNGPMDRGYNPTLAISLFEAADITAQIINGQLASEESEAKNKTRMGYMGHLTLIAEEVVKFNERHPPELLSETVLEKVMSPEWSNYVEGALAETRERDNAILGGVRPEVAMNNRAAAQGSGLAAAGLSSLGSGLGGSHASSALADAGLNGGMDLQEGGGLAQFAISSGTVGGTSGFGSSSDEDEDEDNDEDVTNEFRAYTDPLNSSSSLNPPSVPPPPPPPPPLNIPPSRARLQLAARLAMNKRSTAGTATDSGTAEGAGAQENGAVSFASGSRPSFDGSVNPDSPESAQLQPAAPLSERLRDPFADDIDDDDDDDDDADLITGGGSGGAEGDKATGSGSRWNRGNWWRGVVRSKRPGEGDSTNERFGDGRDDDSDDDVDNDDEEFGDFAMPEVTDPPVRASDGPVGALFDREREKVLLKPLPVHPPHSSGGKFGSLWPFDGLGFGSTGSGSTAVGLVTGLKSGSGVAMAQAGTPTAGGEAEGKLSIISPITASPVSPLSTPGNKVAALDAKVAEAQGGPPPPAKADTEAPKAAATATPTDDEPVIVDEDGKRVSRAKEAKRRTSIEDPEDEEVVV